MKTTAIHIAGALILTVCLGISCQKEQPSRIGDSSSVTVMATISDAADTKVTYTEDGNKLKSAWAVGDHIVGWDDSGNKLELEIASDERITSGGVAIFTPVTGSASLPASGKIYMIYAPGKKYSDVGTKTLTVNLSSQAENVIPALMMATGTVSDRQIKLDFSNEMAIVMVKNPKVSVKPNSSFGGLVLSGDNVNTSVTFKMVSNSLTMTPSTPGSITKSGSFSTDAYGRPRENVTFYFAVAPNTAEAQVKVGTFDPPYYEFIKAKATFTAGKCYVLANMDVPKQKFTITMDPEVKNGSFSTSPSGSAEWGSTVTITPSPTNPDTEYELTPKSITVTKKGGGTVTLSGLTFTMPQDNVTVTGAFQKKKYILTSSVNSTTMGSVALKYTDPKIVPNSIASGSDIEWGSGVTVVPTANPGYVVDQVKYNDGSDHTVSLASSAYKFNMPKHDATVTVTFKIQVPGTTPEYPITPW